MEESGRQTSKKKLKKLYLLNVGSAEEATYKKLFSRVHRLDSFEELSETGKNSMVLVEDIINMTKTDEKVLRRGLNYDAHHKTQK